MKTRRILHVAVALPLVSLFFLGLQTASVADMTVTQEITTTIGDSKTMSTQDVYWTTSKMRTFHPAGIILITDLEAKTVTAVNPKQKTYAPNTFQEIKQREAALPAKVEDTQLSVQETGEKKTMDGYPCEKLIFKIGPAEITAWVTTKIAIDPAVVEFDKEFLELTKGIKSLNLEPQIRAAFEKRKAYPYLMIIEVPAVFGGNAQRIENRVKKVSYEKIEPSVFAIPEGYKKATIPPMPSQK